MKSKLQKKLDFMHQVYGGYASMKEVYRLFKEGKIKLEEHTAPWDRLPDLANFDNWSTYKQCATITICEGGEVKVRIKDGDLYDGSPTNRRWEASFSGLTLLKPFTDIITKGYLVEVAYAYDCGLEEKRLEAISVLAENLIK